MREKLAEFESRGVRVSCVVQGTAEEAARFCGRHGLAEICIADPSKESYRAMNLGRASWRNILFASPDYRRRRAEAGQAGCRNSLTRALQKHSAVLQLPGAALVARGGNILWLRRGSHPGDLPSAEALLKVVDQHLERPVLERPAASS